MGIEYPTGLISDAVIPYGEAPSSKMSDWAGKAVKQSVFNISHDVNGQSAYIVCVKIYVYPLTIYTEDPPEL